MSVVISENSAAPTPVRSGARLRHILLMATVAALPLAGCSSLEGFNPFGGEKYKTEILPDIPAEKLYNQGLAKSNAGSYKDASKKFMEIEKQYPFSVWAQKGLLMSTFANYRDGNFDDAISQGKRYVATYPTSPDAAYALYLVGESQYEQISDISRDQDTTEKALQSFQELITKYPNSEYVADSKFKIQVAHDQLSGKEMSIGRFYLTRKNYVAAINRFRVVLAQYQTTRHTEEALERLVEAYMGLGIVNEAQTAAAILGHNYPDSQWYKDAYALLQSGGVEPREDKGSWISKIFSTVGL